MAINRSSSYLDAVTKDRAGLDATAVTEEFWMALKIRLRRMGRRNAPTYRVVVAESSAPRDGRIVESIGHYNPRTEPLTLVVDRARALYWINLGATPTDTVQALLKRAGIYRPEEAGVAAAAGAAAGAVAQTAKKAGGAVRGAAGKVAGAVKGAAGGVAHAAAAAVDAVKSAHVADVASSAVGAVKEVAGDVRDAAANAVGAVVNRGENAEAPAAQADAAPAAEVETQATEAEAAPTAEAETPAAAEDKKPA
jgi:small subunit ribosomal protein S16